MATVFLQQMDTGWIFTVGAIAWWYFIQSYGSSIYTWLLDQFHGDHSAVSFVLSGLMPLVGFILYGLLQYCVDTFAVFEGFRKKYKVQLAYMPDNAAYWQGIKVAARNWLLLGMPYAALVSWVVGPYRGNVTGSDIPPAWTWIWQLVVFVAAEEVMFYYSHRALHAKSIYK
jgi:sterol desaturase/sphingolipid hydroxylase (fatty acid hydroxylase superfamily)